MIKLKNLWKIALATMAMSTMLIACDETSGGGSSDPDDPMAKYKTTPVLAKADSFTYGFKFSTEEGWGAQMINANAVLEGTSFEKTVLRINATANMNPIPGTDKDPAGNTYADDSTKIFVDSGEFVSGKLYTITYNKTTGEVKLTEAASGVAATEIKAQEANPDGNFPAGIYISGYLGGNWAASDNAGSAIMMDNASDSDIYSFTWAAPAATITVTLKITMDIEATEDTPASNSTLYLRDVPVKTDGTSAIDGSIYSWYAGTAVTIKDVDASNGGIYDAAMTAKSNAAWALTNFVNGNENVDLAKQFNLTGADDVLQLSIDAERWVPYIKGQTCTYSWKLAQEKLEASE